MFFSLQMPSFGSLDFKFVGVNDHGYQVIAVSVAWWLSFVWICRHIWLPEIDRLAFSER